MEVSNFYDLISHGGRRESMAKETAVKYIETDVTCACGNNFQVNSNKKELHLETCNQCHPFYSGKDGLGVSKTGRVEKFNRKYGLNTKEA